MTHHWRPSDHLERAPGRNEWMLIHRGIQLGRIEYGRVGGRPAFRSVADSTMARSTGTAVSPAVIGFAWGLESACDRLWDWSVRVRPQFAPVREKATSAVSMTAWPWLPIRISETEWIIMRNSASRPKAVVKRLEADPGHPSFYRAVSWAPISDQRRLIGYFPSLDVADLAILEDASQLITDGPAG